MLMFKVTWDTENNGIILSNQISDSETITPPRPVFFEELDLLGFNDFFEYPKSKEPLLWSIGRKYYSKGECIAEANGGNIYDKPEINLVKKMIIEPINVTHIIDRNIESLKIIESEAIDFIQDLYYKYHDNIDAFAVAFSGGKDSQVVLDLVSRVLSPNEYLTIFNDTTMEIPFTHEVVRNTINNYSSIYPNMKFFTVKPNKNALQYWDVFGPPSRIHRWCCSVYKTAPFGKFFNSYNTDKPINNGKSNFLVFEGVRAEESNRRSKYSRITHNIKGTKQINAEIILYWNLSEVFLYLLNRNIEFNKGYRFGLVRVGCAVCPFSSNWSEYILRSIYKNNIDPFINIIKENIYKESNDQSQVKNFISSGQWKSRAGGRNLSSDQIRIDIKNFDNKIIVNIENRRENFIEWIKVLSDIEVRDEHEIIMGELNTKNKIKFKVKKNDINKTEIIIQNPNNDLILKSHLKKIIYKTAYCVNCGMCEAICPNNAINFFSKVKIDISKCTHCLKCLSFTEKGCLLAKSMSISEGNGKMNNRKIATSKYQTFGLREEWLNSYLQDNEDWIEKNKMRLGNRQLQSMIAWLKDSELLDKEKNPSILVNKMKLIFENYYDAIWPVIWTNLYYNVKLVKWYCDEVKWGSSYSSKDLVQLIVGYDSINKEKTSSNAVNSLLNLFENSQIGLKYKIGMIEKLSNLRYVKKIGYEDIPSIAIAYCIYKYAEKCKRYNFKLDDFFNKKSNGGPYKLFGISKEKLKSTLIGLQENKNIIQVDFTANLDNINLYDKVSSINVLDILR